MAISLKKTEEAYKILKSYNGENPYIITLKNNVYAYKVSQLNDFQVEFVNRNYDKKPILINKVVRVTDWWGEKKQEEWNLDFKPEKLLIGWYIGDTTTAYVFYAQYRKSIEPKLMFAPKSAILTDFLINDWRLKEIDFKPYNERSGRKLYPHQEEAVKFLTARKKAILADQMGFGKTASAIVSALEGKYRHILIVCPASVKETWKNELLNYVDENEVTIVNGSKWDDAKFTIINYDILDNFYKIPTQKIKNKELNVDDNGKIITEIKEKEIVSRNQQIIYKAMRDSQLFKSNFDLFIIDEAHRLSNSSSGRFKIIKDLIKRSNPDGIFELTGTMITNGAHNLYNLLKIIGCRVTDNWCDYMKKYCGAKVFYKKGPKMAYTKIFLKQYGKKEWKDLTYDEKTKLNEFLEAKCPKITIPGEDTNMDELQEIIKPYYLRRVTDDLKTMVSKDVKFLHYQLSDEEKISYDEIWQNYQCQLETEEKVKTSEKYKKLIEGTILRQWLADKMIPRTISLTKKCIEKGHKVIIFCAYDNEINTFKKEFEGISVFHNGKITLKKKNEAVEEFQNNDNIKVFIGNIQSASVGLTLTAGDVVIFNNFSFVPADNLQAENRIHRLNQTKPCTIYYQSFNGTYFDKMLNIVRGKEDVINNIIVSEKEK